jgi:Bacterial Ig domain/Fibronectin type III domain
MPSRYHRSRSGLVAVVLVSGITLLGSLVEAVDVRLAWNASPSPQVTGYQLHYGTASGQYSVHVDTGPATTAALSGLQAGQTYYFAALAYDAAGNHSPFSNEVSYAVPAGDTTPPTVAITSPENGAPVPRRTDITINVSASDNVEVTLVTIAVDGAVLCADSAAPYTCVWSVPAPPGRTYTAQATASDAANNTASASIMVISQ